MSFTFYLTWRGNTTVLMLPVADPTMDEVGLLLERELGASFETLKLMIPGRKGHIAPARQGSQTASEAGLPNGCKVLLLASRAEDVTRIRAARDLPSMRSFHDELVLAARRRRTGRHNSNLQPPQAEFTFGAYEPWQRPGLHPPPGEALKLLYRLGADPGILGVMAAHRYRVGLLSELPPEGKVGISPECILGVNIGAGHEISLRLRTDDLKGFRKYERVRETLIHELAHIEYGDHDNDFKRHNSQLGRECAAINARYIGGHSLLDDPARRFAAAAAIDSPSAYRPSELDDPSLLEGAAGVMAATALLSGKTLRQLAAAGSVTAGGSGVAAAGPATAVAGTTVAVTAKASTAAPWSDVIGGGSEDGDGGEALRQFEHHDATTEMAEAAARRLGAWVYEQQLPPQQQPQPSQKSLDGWVEGNGADGGGGDGKGDEKAGNKGKPSPASAAVAPTGLEQAEGTSSCGAAPSAAVPMDVDRPPAAAAVPAAGVSHAARESIAAAGGIAVPAALDPADAVACPRGSPTGSRRLGPSQPQTPAATGEARPERHQQGAALAQKLQPRLKPPLRLTLRPPEDLAAASGGGGSVDTALEASKAKLHQAWSALAQMAAATAHDCPAHVHRGAPPVTAEDVATALDALETLLGNTVHFPTEERYRRIRLGNGAFQRRVGRLPGGLEVLRVAGFREEREGGTGGGGVGLALASGGAQGTGQDAVMRLRRNDPGLLWLVLSVVRGAREQVAAQLAEAGSGSRE